MLEQVLMSAALALTSPDYSIITTNDYPNWALDADKSAAAILDMVISPSGDLLKCELASYVGDKELAKYMCHVAKYKKFSPARVRTH